MEAELRDKPSFTNLRLQLAPGDEVIAESDAMAHMSSSISMTTQLNGGLIKGVLRRYFGGESMFVNRFTTDTGGELVITQPYPGDMVCLELKGNSMYLQPGAFVACEPGVELGLGWAGLRMLLGGEGLFRLKVSGHGRIWFGAYGGIFEREIDSEYVVDTGHLVAYEPTVGIRAGMVGGLFSSFFSGEGLVTRVNGPGRIYLQSRSFGGLAAWTNAYL